MISKETKKEILNATRETLESSSIHAIPNITKNKYRSIKFVWLICFLASSGVCAWFMYRSVTDYLNYDVVSQTDIRQATKLVFPVVTICNLNLIKTNDLNDYFINLFGSEYPNIINEGVAKGLLKENSKKYLNQDVKLKDIILKCQFETNDCDLDSDFESYYDPNYGTCFRFNSGRNMNGTSTPQKYASSFGIFFGLELELFIGSIDQNNYLFSSENGFNIFISNQSYFNSNYNEGINIPAGFSSKISIQQNVLIKQPKPYSYCTADISSINSYDSEIFKIAFSKLNKTYFYYDCIFLCLQKYFAQQCGCQYFLFTIYYDYGLRTCAVNISNTNKDYECLRKSWSNYSESKDILTDCDCPVECERTYYTYSNSIAEFPTLKYSNYIRNYSQFRLNYSNMTYEEMRKNVAKVNIFYDELKQTVLSESVKTEISDLISNLGGLLGLFLGLSFLSLIEFVELILQTFLIMFKDFNIKNNNKIQI